MKESVLNFKKNLGEPWCFRVYLVAKKFSSSPGIAAVFMTNRHQKLTGSLLFLAGSLIFLKKNWLAS